MTTMTYVIRCLLVALGLVLVTAVGAAAQAVGGSQVSGLRA